MNLLSKISDYEDQDESTILMILITVFFGIDGIVDYGLNMMIYYLMKIEHHDLWDEYKRKYVTSFEEITEIHFLICPSNFFSKSF